MKITHKQLRQIIREELQRLDEIPTHLKMAAARRGVPHMGSAPGPRRSGDPDDDSDDAAELRDIAADIEVKEPYIPSHLRRKPGPMERAYAKVVTDYEAWVRDRGYKSPADLSVLVTYLIDQDSRPEHTGILSSEYKMDKAAVARELEVQSAEAEAGIVDDDESFERGFYSD